MRRRAIGGCAAVVALVLLACGPRPAVAQTPGTPLNIAADNVSGSHGPEGDIVVLNGNVRITRGKTVLTADAGRYLRQEGMLYLDGRVKMVDSSATVTCDHVSYSETTDVLQLEGNVELHDHESTVRAPSGTYDRKAGRADLTGGIDGRDRKLHLLADRATYFRDSLMVQARGNVRGIDDENKTELDGPAVDYDRGTHVALATGDPVLRARDDDGRVTELHARRMRVDTGTRIAEAIDSVHVVRDTMQVRGDYGRFDDAAGRGWVVGHPRAWDDQTTVTGDTLEIESVKRELRRVVVRGRARMDYRGNRANNLGETSLLVGDRVVAYVARDRIDSLLAVGNARNDYQAVALAGKTPDRNSTVGDSITVFFRERKIDRARVTGDAKGEYHLAADVKDTTAVKLEMVQYDARGIEYIVPKSRIVLDGAAHLTYRDLALTARRVEFDVDAQTLVAEGKPVLLDRGDRVTGHLMTYDLGSRQGTIYDAQTTYERGLYHGERIRKVNDNELDVLHGNYSTCDLADPHYHFSARWMKIFLKDKLVAKPVVFYLKHVPILALPFWVFPIKSGRHSGFLFPQFELGFNNRSGQFFRNAGYYWAPNDYMDLTVAGDYYQAEPSWVLRADSDYRLMYVLDGSMHGSFARNEATGHEDWDFNAAHAQDVTPRTRVTAQGQFVSSRDYSSSPFFGRSISQRVNRFLTSNVAFSHNADWASFNAVVDRRQDLDADASLEDPDGEGPLHGPGIGALASLPNLTESLPDLSIAFPTRALGSLGFLRGTPLQKSLSTLYFSLNAHFLDQTERRGAVTGFQTFPVDSFTDSSTVIGERVSERRGLAASSFVSDSRRLFGWLNLAPRLSVNSVVFDFDEQGHKVVPAATWSSSVGMSSTFYGSFRPKLGRLVGLRHVVFPNLTFSYSPDFRSLTFVDTAGVRRSRFSSFGGIGISGFKQERLDFGVDQRLQAKVKHGDRVDRIDNLVSWTLGSSVDFLYRDHGLTHPLTPIRSAVFVQPPGIANANLSWTTDVYSARPLRNLTYNVGVNLASGGAKAAGSTPELPVDRTATSEPVFNENWSLGLAYSYSGGYTSGPRWTDSRTANTVLRYQLSPAWGVEYSGSYDLTLHSVQIQRFALTRDLHCWQATFTRTFSAGGEAEYYFRLGIKDQRELYVERGSRVGSIGGIQ